MQTDDPLENLTEHSDAVQVIVRDYNGRIRVFNLDNAKVMLRYKDNLAGCAYHPSNITTSGSYRPAEGDWLELVIATEELITLESED